MKQTDKLKDCVDYPFVKEIIIHNPLIYEVQYSLDRKRLWVHCSSGDTVGRYDVRSGIDIHTTIKEQMEGKPQCLHCTHGKSNP